MCVKVKHEPEVIVEPVLVVVVLSVVRAATRAVAAEPVILRLATRAAACDCVIALTVTPANMTTPANNPKPAFAIFDLLVIDFF